MDFNPIAVSRRIEDAKQHQSTSQVWEHREMIAWRKPRTVDAITNGGFLLGDGKKGVRALKDLGVNIGNDGKKVITHYYCWIKSK